MEMRLKPLQTYFAPDPNTARAPVRLAWGRILRPRYAVSAGHPFTAKGREWMLLIVLILLLFIPPFLLF